MRVGEKLITLREAHIGTEVFVTARDHKRLVDYKRFPAPTYSREEAVAAFRQRFLVSRLAWSEEQDQEFSRSFLFTLSKGHPGPRACVT